MERVTRDGLDRLTAFLADKIAASPTAAAPRGGPELRRAVEEAAHGVEAYLTLAERGAPRAGLEASREQAEQLWEVLERAAALWEDHPPLAGRSARCRATAAVPVPAGGGRPLQAAEVHAAARARGRAGGGMDEPRATVTRHLLTGRVLVYRVSGELDLESADLIGFDAAVAQASTLVLDLAGLDFCDSAGLNSLLRLRLKAGEHGVPVHLADVSDRVARLLRVTGADEVFPIHGTLDEAVTALG